MLDRSLNLAAPSPRPRRPRARGAVLVLVGALTLAAGAAACSPTSTESTTPTTEATSTTAGTVMSSVRVGDATYGSIEGLHQAIVDGGFTCTLEYPGLEDDVTSNEVSICTIEDETAYLTIWGDPAKLVEFTNSADGATGAVAVGGDWTISVTSADLAERLAGALGGTAPSGT